MKILHTSDLHLDSGDDKEYSLGVFKEIIEISNRSKADVLLLAGDVFNTFSDIEALHLEFREIVSQVHKDCTILYIAGNHESLNRGSKRIANYDLGIDSTNLFDTGDAPCKTIKIKDIEFLCVPHQADYKTLHETTFIEPAQKLRIAVAHGILTGTSLSSLLKDDEGDAGIIDASFFERNHVNYICLGHIHAAQKFMAGSIEAWYPGSPRVWRKGETGERFVNLLKIDGSSITTEQIVVSRAGQYKNYPLFLGLEEMANVHDKLVIDCGPLDYVNIELSGIARGSDEINELKKIIMHKYTSACRTLNIDERGVKIIQGMADVPLLKTFLSHWEKAIPESAEGYDVWQRARQLGIEAITANMRGL